MFECAGIADKCRPMAKFLCAAFALVIAGGAHLRASEVEKPFAVPRVMIYPGDQITDSMLTDKKLARDSNLHGQSLASREQAVGRIARRTLLPGQPIVLSSLRLPYAVLSGKAVSIIFASGALTITGRGLALQSGAVGDVVAVQNTDSSLIIRGFVTGDGVVEIGE